MSIQAMIHLFPLLQLLLLLFPRTQANVDLACGLLTTCSACRTRLDCTWCFIARGNPRCDPVAKLHRRNNECIAPLFDARRGNHQHACDAAWAVLGNLPFENSAVSETQSPHKFPLGLTLKSPHFGQHITTTTVSPLIEIQLLQQGMKELDVHDQLCFWVHHSATTHAPILNIDADVIQLFTPTVCNDRIQMMSGILASLDIPPMPGSYLIAVQIRASNTKLPRSGTSYTLVDRYPIEVHEWGDLFREDYLNPTRWWQERIEHDTAKNLLGPSLLFHNRASATSQHLHTIPVGTSLSTQGRRQIPKIMHQIWTGGVDELIQFQQELPPDDKRHWFHKWRQTCVGMHLKTNGWTHMFWDTVSMRTFVLEHFPAMFEQYENMDLKIKRTDVARMLILLHHGGTYVDIDFECLRPFETAIQYGNEPLDVDLHRYGTLASENDLNDGTINMYINVKSNGNSTVDAELPPPLLYVSEHRTNLPIDHLLKGRELPNAFMAAIPWHPLIWVVTMEMLRRDFLYPRGYVTQTTGPHVFSEIVFGYLESYVNANVEILKVDDLFPVYCLDKQQMKVDATCIANGNCAEVYPNSLAVHHYAASWYPEVAKHLGL